MAADIPTFSNGNKVVNRSMRRLIHFEIENRLTHTAFLYLMFCAIRYHLYNLRNVRKKPWRSATVSKVAGFSLQFY